MDVSEVEKKLQEIEKDLRFCENLLNKEARMELAKRILEELLNELRKIKVEELPAELRSRFSNMELRIRILYHRANALLSLQEE
ncbi:MAG: hypothetical protein DRN59_00745 [Thaumarchaeota archaeon]|nr:MAG: hypothetical protein DRN59_00745 [Nitrososphaerota archaeon]